MPRNLAQYTHCAAPGDAYPMSAGKIALIAFGSLVIGAIGGSIFLIVSALMGQAASLGCVLGTGLFTFLAAGGLLFKDWYYNWRLMCIQHDQCNCGTIVGQPHSSFDGDRKVEILIAPFDVPETEQLLRDTLVAMGAGGQLANVPDAADLQDRQVLFGYLRGLSDAQQAQVYVDLADNGMFNQPGRDFLRHFYRRDEARMGTPAFTNSPDDTGASPNPMFRINPQEGEDPEEHVVVPYMHCEIEGHSMALFLDNLIAAVIAAGVTFVAVCAVCTALTAGAGVWLCAGVAAAAALIIGLLVWLIAQFGVNKPSDGAASEIDVDVQDPDFDTPPATAQQGDVVYLFGDWIMDEEHGNYFEIHPIKAHYLLCRGATTTDDWQLTEETPAKDCAFDVKQLDAAEFDRICRIVMAVESTDPDDRFTTTITRALSTYQPERPDREG